MATTPKIWTDGSLFCHYHAREDRSDIRGAVILQDPGGWRPFAPFGCPIHACGIEQEEAKRLVEQRVREMEVGQ